LGALKGPVLNPAVPPRYCAAGLIWAAHSHGPGSPPLPHRAGGAA